MKMEEKMLFIRSDGYMCFRESELPPELVTNVAFREGEFVFCPA
jgi:hypothetical protein